VVTKECDVNVTDVETLTVHGQQVGSLVDASDGASDSALDAIAVDLAELAIPDADDVGVVTLCALGPAPVALQCGDLLGQEFDLGASGYPLEGEAARLQPGAPLGALEAGGFPLFGIEDLQPR